VTDELTYYSVSEASNACTMDRNHFVRCSQTIMPGLAEALENAKMQKTAVKKTASQKSKLKPASKKAAAGQKTTKAARKAKKN
jgi:hypothetical protein